MDYGLDYSKAKGHFSKSTGMAGSNSRKDSGSYAMLPAESVSSNLSRRIDGGWCRIDRVGRDRWSGAERGSAMARTSELAGVVGSRPMGYGFARE